MTKRWGVVLLLVLVVVSPRAAGPTITIDAGAPSGKVSPLFAGLMTEEINHAYDGGLYAELVHNRAFLDDATSPVHWSIVQTGGAAATMALDRGEPLNQSIPTSLRLDVTQASSTGPAGVVNGGYWGIPVKPNTRYRASFYAKTAAGFAGPVTVSIQSDDGRTTYASASVTGITPGVEAVRGDAADRQRRSHHPGTICPHDRQARQSLVQSRLAVSADVQESAERVPAGSDADAHRHETDVPAVSRWQLP